MDASLGIRKNKSQPRCLVSGRTSPQLRVTGHDSRRDPRRKLSPQTLQEGRGVFRPPGFLLLELIAQKKNKEREKVSDPIEGRRLLLARVEWQSFKNMARSIVQIWSVTRKTIRRTRSRPLDPTRSGLKAAPTGPGNSLGQVGGMQMPPGGLWKSENVSTFKKRWCLSLFSNRMSFLLSVSDAKPEGVSVVLWFVKRKPTFQNRLSRA